MRKRDEVEYYKAIQAKGWGVFADAVAERLEIDWDRAQFLLSKWAQLGWWAHDVSLRSGHLTDLAPLELLP